MREGYYTAQPASPSGRTQLTTVNADRKPDKLPTTVDGAPMQTAAPGPIQADGGGA